MPNDQCNLMQLFKLARVFISRWWIFLFKLTRVFISRQWIFLFKLARKFAFLPGGLTLTTIQFYDVQVRIKEISHSQVMKAWDGNPVLCT
jgi:hypothetical protein